MRLPLAFALVATVAACTDPDDVPTATTSAALGGVDPTACPKLICGNTPYLGAYPFWELDLTGATYSSNGLRIKSAVHGGVSQRLIMNGFRLQRLPGSSTTPQPINDTVITLESNATSTTYELTITNAAPVDYVEGADDNTTPVLTYGVKYVVIEKGKRRGPIDLCGPDPGSSLPRPAILFQGDRYSSTTGALVATGPSTQPWFNITCKDDALWKLALMRHVEAAEDQAHQTSDDQRMALLRSIRADYCGDGTPHTELGTAIDWINVGGWLTQDTDGYVEAVWRGSGAVCVDNTRVPDTVIDCGAAPEPPTCNAYFADWTTHGSVVTLVPESF